MDYDRFVGVEISLVHNPLISSCAHITYANSEIREYLAKRCLLILLHWSINNVNKSPLDCFGMYIE